MPLVSQPFLQAALVGYVERSGEVHATESNAPLHDGASRVDACTRSDFFSLSLRLPLLDGDVDDPAGECVVVLFVIGRDVGLGVETDVRAFIG